MAYIQGSEQIEKFGDVSVELRVPTERTLRKIIRGVNTGEDEAGLELVERAIRACVLRVDGLAHRGRAIATAEELLEYAPIEWIERVGWRILEVVTGEPSGPLSVEPSASSSMHPAESKADAQTHAAASPEP